MEISDYLALTAVIISIGTFAWNEYKDIRKKKTDSLIELAITFDAEFRFGIAELGRQLRNENAYAADIAIAVHNIGNAIAVVNRMFLMEKLEDGNYDFFHEFKMEIDTIRILKPTESHTYYNEISGSKIKILDVKLSNKTMFIRIYDSKGNIFDSPRN